MHSHYPPTLYSAPATTPVSAADARAQIPGATSDDDTLIAALLAAAVGSLDGYSGTLGRCLITQTWDQKFDYFCDPLRLPMPAASITSVTYVDTAGSAATASTSLYALRHDAEGSYVALKINEVWPNTTNELEAVTVRFVAGYGAASDVPAPIKQAIILMASKLFQAAKRDTTLTMERIDGVSTYQWDNSGALVQAFDQTINALIAPYRRVGL